MYMYVYIGQGGMSSIVGIYINPYMCIYTYVNTIICICIYIYECE